MEPAARATLCIGCTEPSQFGRAARLFITFEGMDEYEPIKVLGEGSFGKVYLMKHKDTRDLVCTKVSSD